MKRVLITGKSSYVGMNLIKWLNNYSESYLLESISLRENLWEKKDFSNYEVVVHVAGIAHIKETKSNAYLYYSVNRDLAYDTAKKAKKEGVKHFIFLSSMSVYGIESGVINSSSLLKPKSNYGKSKLQAEELIKTLEDDSFKVAILRPPMIYGKGCKGNYTRLAKFALKSPLFPNIKNKRSMLYIDNLSEFIRLVIDDISSGVFHPQNKEYVCTSDIVGLIAESHGRDIKMTKMFNYIISIININVINKVFGDLVYENKKSEYNNRHVIFDFESTIRLTEKEK